MTYSIERALLFVALATITLVVAYLYQRNERKQRVTGVWMWPAIFALLAAQALIRNRDVPHLFEWCLAGFPIGVALGILRGVVFGLRPGEKPGEMLLRPNLVSGAVFLIVFYINEFVHVFHQHNDNLKIFATAFMVLTVGNSLAVNVTRLVRYRAMTREGPPAATRAD